MNTIIGQIILKKTKIFIKADQYNNLIEIDSSSYNTINKINTGTIVEAKIIKYPYLAKIIQIIGKNGNFLTEIKKIIINSGIKTKFTDSASKEASIYKNIKHQSNMKQRLNLTKLAFCTIDSKTSKDFDDAVLGTKIGKNFKLIVAIADVAHYVRQGSVLDNEAYIRATSIYYPGHCIPMIPEQLSNGLCSLQPNKNRLCLIVEMIINTKGIVKNIKINNAIIKSKAKLTYQEVQKFIDTNTLNVSHNIKISLNILIKIARILRKARKKRGSLIFNIKENYIKLNKLGEPLSIQPNTRLEAHNLIEDIMITTNEAVATFIKKNKQISIYRIHEKPDEKKLHLFLNFAQAIGFLNNNEIQKLIKTTSSKIVTNIANKLTKHNLSPILNISLLKSIPQARYSEKNIGHFGLRTKNYLHFTSPIRRYADLIVHRIIKSILSKSNKTVIEHKFTKDKKQIQNIAIHCSNKERKIIELERKIDALHNTWFMRKKIGTKANGIVTSCTDFGAFVRLNEYHVEGLVHINKINKGFLEYNPSNMRLTNKQSNFSIGVGDKVVVKLTSINIKKCHIDLKLI